MDDFPLSLSLHGRTDSKSSPEMSFAFLPLLSAYGGYSGALPRVCHLPIGSGRDFCTEKRLQIIEPSKNFTERTVLTGEQQKATRVDNACERN